MNAKEMNPFERHVEKIVLGVAALGALYMGYLAIQPVTIEGDIPVEKVEDKIASAIDDMNRTKVTNQELGEIRPQIRNYAREYADLVNRNPLLPELAMAAAPGLGPKGVKIGDVVIEGPQDEGWKVVTPTPAKPEMMWLEPFQQTVSDAAPAAVAANGGAAPVAVGTHDQNAAVIQGYLPIAEMLSQMAVKPLLKGNPQLPPELQRISIASIDVQRREKVPGAQWKPVPRAKTATDDIPWGAIPPGQQELIARMDQVDQEFKQIVIPDVYLDDKGVPVRPSILTRQKPADVTARENALMEEVKKAGPLMPHPPGAPLNSTPAPTPGGGVDPIDDPLGMSAAAAAPISADVAAIKNQALVPFAIWDPTVEADHEYEYQVRVKYVNPTLNFTKGLAKPEMKTVALLDTGWVKVPGSVKVKLDTVFFVTNPDPARPGAVGPKMGAEVKVFKRTGGKWYGATFNVQVGEPVTAQVSLLDGGKPIEVNTGYILVDAQAAGSGVRAVMVDGEGRMITRESAEDRAKPERTDLETRAEKLPPPSRPATTRIAPTVRTPPGRGTNPPNGGLDF